MKKIILASVAAISVVSASGAFASSATASTFCAGTAGSSSVAGVSATDNFVKTAFTPKCSANVHLAGQDGNTYYRVGSTNVKGGRAWMGSTAGGGVASTPCSNTSACTAADATAAATNASNVSS